MSTHLLFNALQNQYSDDDIKLCIQKVRDVNVENEEGESILMIANVIN